MPLPALQCTVDLPIGYKPVEITESKATFTVKDNTLYFQIKTYPGSQFSSTLELFNAVKKELRAEGEGSRFVFNEKEAILADLRFQAGEFAFTGYFLFMNGTALDTVLLSFTESDMLEELGQFVLSALDSYQDATVPHPAAGPVSQFLFVPGAGQKTEIMLADKKLAFTFDKNEAEVSRDTIKREFSILTAYTDSPDWKTAWPRFYRMVFRDNYARLRPLAEEIKKQKELTSLEPRAQAALLLQWLQSFSFQKEESFSDFTDPLTVLANRAGDCDSKGLVYAILTRYLGLDTILMVSAVYKHALAGIDVKGKGARFPYKNKQYLIAEFNEQVELGLIAADMADAANWLAVEF